MPRRQARVPDLLGLTLRGESARAVSAEDFELQAVIDALPSSFIHKDTRNRMVRVNRAFDAQVGAEPSELAGRLAKDGREAVAKVEQARASISVVLLDLTMPGMSGEETFLAIRRIDAELPILLMSGFTERQAMAASFQAVVRSEPST